MVKPTKAGKRRGRDLQRGHSVRIPLLAVAVIIVAGALAAYAIWPGKGDGSPNAWATLGTADVHALAFAAEDGSHLYFGHHGGLLETRDGGRSWQPTSLSGVDAMNVQTADSKAIQIAGHEVFVESLDGGASWRPVPNDLPGLDLHAFVVDPVDPNHAWTSSVGFGLFETHDGGRHWQLRQPGNWGYLVAYRRADGTALLAVSSEGGVRSLDGGVTWQVLPYVGAPLAGGMTAAADGSVLYAATIGGLRRSADEGQSWQETTFRIAALAVAVDPAEPMDVAVVDESTRFFRSSDGGQSWPAP